MPASPLTVVLLHLSLRDYTVQSPRTFCKGWGVWVGEGRLIYPCLLPPQYMGCVEVLQSMRALDFNTRTQVTRLVERVLRVGEVTEVSVRRRREVEHLVVVLVATSHRMAKRIERKLQKLCLTGNSQLWSGAPPYPSSTEIIGRWIRKVG